MNIVPVSPDATSPEPYRRNATEEERREALKYLSEMRVELPEGWKFDREEANER